MRDGERVDETSTGWLGLRDSYGIEVLPRGAGLVVACVVALDVTVHPTR